MRWRSIDQSDLKIKKEYLQCSRKNRRAFKGFKVSPRALRKRLGLWGRERLGSGYRGRRILLLVSGNEKETLVTWGGIELILARPFGLRSCSAILENWRGEKAQ